MLVGGGGGAKLAMLFKPGGATYCGFLPAIPPAPIEKALEDGGPKVGGSPGPASDDNEVDDELADGNRNTPGGG